MKAHTITEGAVVRVRRHNTVGTVVRVDGDGELYVAYPGTFVEDQVSPHEVDIVPDPTPEQAAWRGGVGILGAGRVEPVRKGR